MNPVDLTSDDGAVRDLRGEPSFFVVFHSLVDDGHLAAMGDAVPVYLWHLRHRAGWSSAEQIAAACGIDPEEAAARRRRLVDLGYLRHKRAGEKNEYQVTAQGQSQSSSSPAARQPQKEQVKQEPTPDFLRFWEAYPGRRKTDKTKCLRHWLSKKLDAQAEAILAGLEAAKASADWTKEGGEFVPMPFTWLNNRRWEGAPPPPAPVADGLFGDVPGPRKKGRLSAEERKLLFGGDE